MRKKDAFSGCHGDWRAFWFCGIDAPLTNNNHPDTLSFGTESECIKRHLVNILAKNMRFRGEFGFYTWFCFVVNEKIAPETSTKNSIFVIRKIRTVTVSSLSGIKETINVVNHVRCLLHKELCKKCVGFVWLHAHFSGFRQALDLRTHPSSRVRGHFPQPPLQSTEALKPVKNLWQQHGCLKLQDWAFCELLACLNNTPKFKSSHYFLLSQSLWQWSPESAWGVTFLIAVTKTVRRRESLFLECCWKVLHHGEEDIAVGVEAVVTLHPSL